MWRGARRTDRWLMLAVLLSAPLARAQEEPPVEPQPSEQPTVEPEQAVEREIEDLVQQATAAHARGDYRAAAELFERALARDRAASLQFNAAQAWRSAGESARAADGYAAALDMARAGAGELDPISKGIATKQLGALRRRVARVTVPEPKGARVSVAHVIDATIPADIHLQPGSHILTVTRPDGKLTARPIEVRAGQALTIHVDKPPAREPRRSASARPKGAGAQPPDEPRGLPPLRIAGWTVLALGVALGGVTAYLGFETLAADDDWEASGFHDLPTRDRAVRFKTWTNITLAAALASGGAGVIMLVVPIADDTRAHMDLRLMPSEAHATLTF